MTAYGSDAVHRFEAELAKVPEARRDPWISFGIPPALNPEFQRSGRGSMFRKPHHVEKTARVHLPVHKADGVEFPTLRLTEAKRKRLRTRHRPGSWSRCCIGRERRRPISPASLACRSGQWSDISPRPRNRERSSEKPLVCRDVSDTFRCVRVIRCPGVSNAENAARLASD